MKSLKWFVHKSDWLKKSECVGSREADTLDFKFNTRTGISRVEVRNECLEYATLDTLNNF